MKLSAIHPFCLFIFLATSLGAQDTIAKNSTLIEPAELIQMRKAFAIRALQSSITLAEQYSTALTTVIKETAALGDYEQALSAQKKHDELIGLYNIIKETKLSNVLILKPIEAHVSGNVNYDRTLGVLINWKNVGSAASWDVQKITPGNYDIIVTYSVAEIGDYQARNALAFNRDDLYTGGEFEFYEDTNLSGSKTNHITGRVSNTGGWDNFVTLNLPPIQLTRSSARFAIKITRIRGEGGVMHLKEIRLSPSKAAPAEQDVPADSTNRADPLKDDLSKLKDAYLTRVKSVIPPVLTAYTSKLKSLSSIADAKKDADLAESVNMEITRTQHIIDTPETAESTLMKSSHYTKSSGFDEWLNVRYKTHPKNGGDRFLVEYKGEDMPVRLLSVTTPYVSADNAANIKQYAAYFGISEEDTIALASRSKDFTEAFLQNKPFRISTRNVKDTDGFLFVNIYPDGVGDYAGVLVDSGLAAINSTMAKAKEGKVIDEPSIIALKERETEARSRPIPPGAWAMVPESQPGKK